jgi:hypothetical protein
MPLALNVIQKKVLCSAEKSSVIWAEFKVEFRQNSSAEPNVRSVTRSQQNYTFKRGLGLVLIDTLQLKIAIHCQC